MSKTWIKVHIEFLDNPKIMTLNLSLRGVWFTALGIAERYDRDGLLPPADRFALMAHTDDETAEKAFAALAKKGLLDETPEGFRIHDWQDWQARKPSDEPEAVAARQAKWYANQKVKDLTRPNALGDVEQKPNAPNANTRARSEIKNEKENREEEEIEPTVLARAPREPSAKQSTHMSIVQALQESCNWDTSKPGTKNELARLHANAKQIADAGGTAEDVQVRAEHYIERWGADKLTPNSLIGHWTECASEPPARASPNGYRPVTITEQKLTNTMNAIAEFERITDEQESLQRTDGPHGDRLRRGDEHPAHARVLGSGEKPQR